MGGASHKGNAVGPGIFPGHREILIFLDSPDYDPVGDERWIGALDDRYMDGIDLDHMKKTTKELLKELKPMPALQFLERFELPLPQNLPGHGLSSLSIFEMRNETRNGV